MKQTNHFFKSMMFFWAMQLMFPLYALSSVTLNYTNVTLRVGEDILITATSGNTTEFAFNINPATGVLSKWKHNLNSIGVTAIAEGTATITCYEMPSLSYKATCKITVQGYAPGYTFYEDSPEGVSIGYVVNEDGNTCSVKKNAVVKSTTGAVTIPQYVKGMKVTGIEKEAFSDCGNITSVTIPKGVNSIGESAFQRCTSLTSISLPSTVTKLGNSCFSGCI